MRKICIIFGGVSSEHEISLKSAASVLRNLNRERWEPVMLGITKDGRWLLYDGSADYIENGTWESSDKIIPAVISPDRSHGGILSLGAHGPQCVKIDAAFGVLHGKNGEDGTVQGLLELAGIPYVGCGVLPSAMCMDKAVTHNVLCAAGIPKTKLEILLKMDLEQFELTEKRLRDTLGYPMFVKPANAGSSIGVSKVSNSRELRAGLELAFLHDKKAVVEQEVIGQEVECSVMGIYEPTVSDVIGEIVVDTGFYDYHAKYLNDKARIVVPAALDEDTAQKVRAMALDAYRAMGCDGFARVDFFVRENGDIVVNELNTTPGFTAISLFPRLFVESGIPYGDLVDRLLDHAFRR